MAIATTVKRETQLNSLYSSVNLRVLDPATIVPGTVLTVAGDSTLQVIRELPNNTFCCEVISPQPRGKNRIIIRVGDTVTG